jgi:hypothetical protein
LRRVVSGLAVVVALAVLRRPLPWPLANALWPGPVVVVVVVVGVTVPVGTVPGEFDGPVLMPPPAAGLVLFDPELVAITCSRAVRELHAVDASLDPAVPRLAGWRASPMRKSDDLALVTGAGVPAGTRTSIAPDWRPMLEMMAASNTRQPNASSGRTWFSFNDTLPEVRNPRQRGSLEDLFRIMRTSTRTLSRGEISDMTHVGHVGGAMQATSS